MTIAYIDTLAIAKKLEALGLQKEIAEGLPEILIDLVNNVAASKGDVREVSNEVAEFRVEVKQDIASLRGEMQKIMLRLQLTAWTVGGAIVAVLSALKYFG